MMKTKQPSKIRTFSGRLSQARRELRELNGSELASVAGGLWPEQKYTPTFDENGREVDCGG